MAKRKRNLPRDWEDRIELAVENSSYEESVSFYIVFIEGKTPRGFKREIACMDVDKEDPHFVLTVTIHDKRLRNKGLGKKIYLAAMEHFGKLSTHFHAASEDAQRVWRSLIRDHNYKTNFWHSVLTVFK